MQQSKIPFELPEEFLLGTATASLQIEGGDKNNSWYRWAEEGHIKDGSHCIIADDHWNRIDEDIELMRKLNNKVYRMSLEWSRIEPKKGSFDEAAIDHYRMELQKLKDAGIKPLITLHHFSNPLWLEDSGSWLNPEVIELFERYTEFVVSRIGDIAGEWITINEPNVYLLIGYVFGEWPPGRKSITAYFKGAKHMIAAHIKSYRKIHEIRSKMGYTDTKVGVAFHLRVYDTKSDTMLEKCVRNNIERLTQEIFVSGMTEGKLIFPVGSGYPLGKGRYFEFFGINYYTRDIVSFAMNPGMMFAKLEFKKDSPKNDLGWEIYPEGLYRLCKHYYERFGAPIYITENGTCDNKDEFRTEYIYNHVFQIKKLIDDGIDVQRYYHWTLLDNFEWIEGLSARFGVIEVNFDTLERKIKRSGSFYAELCKNNAVTEEMIKEFL
ncbi:MAG: glycoside hydrolase family 1 protein [Bacillota bacterium]